MPSFSSKDTRPHFEPRKWRPVVGLGQDYLQTWLAWSRACCSAALRPPVTNRSQHQQGGPSCNGLNGDVLMQPSLTCLQCHTPTGCQATWLLPLTSSSGLKAVSVTKGSDEENLGQSCDHQLTRGTVDCLLYIYSGEEEGSWSTPHHWQSDVHAPHPYLVVLHRGKGEETTVHMGLGIRDSAEDVLLGAGLGQSRGAFSSTHWRDGRYSAAFRERNCS